MIEVPKSKSKKIQTLSKIMKNYADKNSYEFSLFNQSLTNTEAFSSFGALSIFLYSAKNTYEKIMNNAFTVEELMSGVGQSIRELTPEEQAKENKFLESIKMNKVFPIEFNATEEGKSYFEFEPFLINAKDVDFSTVAHFCVNALEEYVFLYKKNPALLIESKIPLDSLFNKLFNDINSKKISLKPPKKFKNSKGK